MVSMRIMRIHMNTKFRYDFIYGLESNSPLRPKCFITNKYKEVCTDTWFDTRVHSTVFWAVFVFVSVYDWLKVLLYTSIRPFGDRISKYPSLKTMFSVDIFDPEFPSIRAKFNRASNSSYSKRKIYIHISQYPGNSGRPLINRRPCNL